ncbi:AbrB/MazE/SpoVT family DNA-binding domain-containing protein [Geminocystis sp. GBBB08]|uniref:AbrB/MazE/SpoVT family DNA-binding domain-containing protein n=1 Tax=Geminocystis sp. GBBB08 TaxID=2604140 RepID=UPI0027E2EB54|nr:AbrB/MazE/SpoVT family DNA-binding domain-containing protein [Geminocystis sp. GBBB08]MBL1209610.1 AbrB/MazE/SpoVT family DNA-binding domain-containing protein [Geminocystis sp. GBBB08]
METKITKIGNSQGIIIPKSILKQCNLKGVVKLEIKDSCLMVSAQNPRQGWEEAIMMTGIDDEILIEDHLKNSWDEEEWTW